MAQPTLAASARQPDLQIQIRVDRSDSGEVLVFQVQGFNDALNMAPTVLDPVSLRACAENRAGDFFQTMEELAKGRGGALSEQLLQAEGATLANELLPEGLRTLLVYHQEQIRTVVILSEEPHIPWELAWLPELRVEGRVGRGAFLCEAFAVARWSNNRDWRRFLPLSRIGLVTPEGGDLGKVAQERKAMLEIDGPSRRVQTVSPSLEAILEALRQGVFDGVHIAGHGTARTRNPNRQAILVGNALFTPTHLELTREGLAASQPFVFLNACQTGRAGFSWTRPGGWGQKLTELGAGAFLGTYWSVRDGKAQTFAEAFYRHFLAGVPIAEAVRWARLELAKRFPGDPTRLAYVLFAHPLAACTENPIGLPDPARELLRTEVKPWDPEVSSPAALLRAEYGIVPFHGREKVQQELEAWAQQDSRLSVRLFTGPGGMGKTRLALETALALQKEGWQAGFVLETSPLSPEELWTKVARPEGRLLLVIDYAETRRPFLVPLLRLLLQVQAGPVRVMLLARAALDWWDQLKSEGDGVGELLAGPATQRIPLRPVAQTLEDRRKSYHLAGRAFAEKLLREPPAHEPANLESPYFERVLLLHMAALGAVDGVNVKDEDGVLDHILARERRYWDRRAKTRSIPDLVVEGIGRSLGAITLRGGVATQTEATEFIGQLAFFQGQDAATVHAVASLLHEVYSTKQRWIEPLQPDLLGEHLVMRELERGADELLTLTLGPAETAPSKDASASAE